MWTAAEADAWKGQAAADEEGGQHEPIEEGRLVFDVGSLPVTVGCPTLLAGVGLPLHALAVDGASLTPTLHVRELRDERRHTFLQSHGDSV